MQNAWFKQPMTAFYVLSFRSTTAIISIRFSSFALFASWAGIEHEWRNSRKCITNTQSHVKMKEVMIKVRISVMVKKPSRLFAHFILYICTIKHYRFPIASYTYISVFFLLDIKQIKIDSFCNRLRRSAASISLRRPEDEANVM